ncbi:hypothetical protein ACJIZ3_019447 [Penstemon smallii]|uniref:PWWP domain-containing protein n=1 Tax=Penstemon smallii TaxID=265156 RepID=A0ABD3T182_9LAMI
MAPGRKRGAKGAKAKNELSLGDLVLAKVKGFPAWPAKISDPEVWKKPPDPKKYFVQFFGTAEIAFVAPVDIQTFTSETKDKLSARCKGKTVKFFTRAVEEICEEFEELQRKKVSGVSDDNSTPNLASETNSLDPVVDEALEASGSNGIDGEGRNCKLEIKGLTDPGTELEHRLQRQGDMQRQDIKLCSSDDRNRSLSPHITSGKRKKLPSNPTNLVKESVSAFSPSRDSLVKDEDSRDIKVEGGSSDGGQIKLTNGHQEKLAIGAKKKLEGAKSGSAVSREHTGEGIPRKVAAGGIMNVTSTDNLKSDLGDSGRKKKKLLNKKKQSEATDDDQTDAELNLEEPIDIVPRKKMKAQHGLGKQTFSTSEASRPAKILKCADIGEDAGSVKVQMNRKNNSGSPNVHNEKTTNMGSKRLASGGKAENRRLIRVQTSTNDCNHSTEEDDLPPSKRHRRAIEAMSSSTLISENKLGSSVSRKNELVPPNKVRSPVMQLPTKRRAVLRCDDEEDELPKTPIHGGFTNKVLGIPSGSDSKKKSVILGESYVPDKLVPRNSGSSDVGLKERAKSALLSSKALSPTAEQDMEKRTRELSTMHVSPDPFQLDSEKLSAKPIFVSPRMSPRSTTSTRSSAESQSKQSSKAYGNISQKKVLAGANKSLSATASERPISSLDQSINERSKPACSGEKRKSTQEVDLQINDPVVVRNPDNTNSVGERLDVAKDYKTSFLDVIKDDKTSFLVDSKIPDSVKSMKHLIAAAQARKRQAHIQSTYGNSLNMFVPDADMHGRSPSPAPTALAFESSNKFQLDIQGLHTASPSSDVRQFSFINQHENEELEEKKESSGHQATGGSLSGGTEAAVARDAFEGMIETLSRTKESIGRATRLAIDCAKYGLANEVGCGTSHPEVGE